MRTASGRTIPRVSRRTASSISGRCKGARWASRVDFGKGCATYASEKIPRSEARGRCHRNGGKCRKAGSSFGLKLMNPGVTDSCTAHRTRFGVSVAQLERGDGPHVVGDQVG